MRFLRALQPCLITTIPRSPLATLFFADTCMAWLWLILRLYRGYEWLWAGWEKLTGLTLFGKAIKGGSMGVEWSRWSGTQGICWGCVGKERGATSSGPGLVCLVPPASRTSHNTSLYLRDSLWSTPSCAGSDLWMLDWHCGMFWCLHEPEFFAYRGSWPESSDENPGTLSHPRLENCRVRWHRPLSSATPVDTMDGTTSRYAPREDTQRMRSSSTSYKDPIRSSHVVIFCLTSIGTISWPTIRTSTRSSIGAMSWTTIGAVPWSLLNTCLYVRRSGSCSRRKRKTQKHEEEKKGATDTQAHSYWRKPLSHM